MDIAHVRFAGEPLAPPASDVSPSVVPISRRSALLEIPSPERDAPADGLAADILALHGLDPHLYRQRPMARRLGACLRALRVRTEAEARSRLPRHEAATRALDTLLIGVSSFFRDPVVFEVLRHEVVPALAALGRPPRVWSVGCSGGAELYSVAILLHQAGLLAGADLLGTDCRASAVAAARRGLFDGATLSHLPPAWRRAYGHLTPDGWLAGSVLTSATRWSLADATRDDPCLTGEAPAGAPWDLILCRNLTIYLRPSAGAALYTRLTRALAPGGYLVVGQAERPLSDLPLVPVGRSTYRHA